MRKKIVVNALLLTTSIGIVAVVIASGHSFSHCIRTIKHYDAFDNSEGKVSFFIGIFHHFRLIGQCEAFVIDQHNGFFAAIAAFVVACFTYALWRSTDKLWVEGRNTFETTERAFVYVDGFVDELTTAADAKVVDINELPERYKSRPETYITRFAVRPRWKNSGNTPTKNMIVCTSWQGSTGQFSPEYAYHTPGQRIFVGPRGVEEGNVIELSASPKSLVDYQFDSQGHEPIIIIWGRADYDDIFGKHHFVEWCYRLSIVGFDGKRIRAHFNQWGEHNRTD